MSNVKLTKKSNIINATFVKPICVGIGSGLVAMAVDKQADVVVDFFGYKMKLKYFYVLLGVTSSLLANSVTETVMSKLNSRIQNLSKETVSVATHAGLNVGIMALLDVNHGIRPEAGIIGVGGSILGDYADSLVSPMLGSYRV